MTVLHRSDVLRVLRYSPTGLTTTEIRKLFGKINPRTVDDCLMRMLIDHEVEKEIERDQYLPNARRWCRWRARC